MAADSIVYLHLIILASDSLKKCESSIAAKETAEDTADYRDLVYFTGTVQHHTTTVFQSPESAL